MNWFGLCTYTQNHMISALQVPTIDSSSPEGLKPDKFEPVIELNNVSFTYPTRADVQVSI